MVSIHFKFSKNKEEKITITYLPKNSHINLKLRNEDLKFNLISEIEVQFYMWQPQINLIY